MLSIITKEEEPKVEEERLQLIEESAQNDILKKEIEENILNLLQNTDSDHLLSNDDLIAQLDKSKETSIEIEKKMADAMWSATIVDKK